MMRIITGICRLLVGVLFIISGLIKANDPLGFAYKLQEYFEVFGTEFLKPMALGLAIFICAFEVLCGVATLTGSKMKPVAWALMLMIVFFTFLTFYSAYFNKVTDCGCFGDALKNLIGRSLTPWESFTKDIILFILIIPIFINRSKIDSPFSDTVDTSIVAGSLFLVTAFSLHCYWHLPVMDFRPYAVGKNIPDQMKIPEGAKGDEYESVLVYKNKKTGESKEFTMAEYSKSAYLWEDTLTWAWEATNNKLIREGYHPPIHDFSIASADGEDLTQKIISNPNYNFLLISYDINEANVNVQQKINEFVARCTKDSLAFVGLAGSSAKEIDNFRHQNNSLFDYYITDQTVLKTIIRSNPGLMLMKNGTVLGIWHYNDFPNYDEVAAKYFKN
ncbi:MAG: DoxX family protein [Bacteroidetes bacterium]|nr:DoxX family protein [Bacteroidota bacterium]